MTMMITGYMMTLHHDGNRWFIDGARFLNVQGNK